MPKIQKIIPLPESRLRELKKLWQRMSTVEHKCYEYEFVNFVKKCQGEKGACNK